MENDENYENDLISNAEYFEVTSLRNILLSCNYLNNMITYATRMLVCRLYVSAYYIL